MKGSRWDDVSCPSMMPCLCERGGATSPEYLAAMEPQRAILEAQIARARTWTLLTFAVIIPTLWLLPGLLYLVARCITRGCHARNAVGGVPFLRSFR